MSELEFTEIDNAVSTSLEDNSNAIELLDAISDGKAVVTADAETYSVDIGVVVVLVLLSPNTKNTLPTSCAKTTVGDWSPLLGAY